MTFGSIPLHACGAQSSADVGLDYPQPKDNPTPTCSQFGTSEDSLRFQVEEDMDAANLVENVIGLLVDDTGTRDLELEREREDDLYIEAEVKGDIGEKGKTERLDYESSRDERG